MNAPRHSRTFKSGNSEAVRLPKGLGFGVGTEVVVERKGDRVVLTPVRDPAAEKQKLLAMLEALAAIGQPDDGVQPRPDFEAPDRPGL
jgi:antitoxin VapB